MRLRFFYILVLLNVFNFSCNESLPVKTGDSTHPDVEWIADDKKDSGQTDQPPIVLLDTQKIKPEEITAFAKTLTGVPYKYASTDPAEGFDCSGFITYVFNHFKTKVPRSSVDFTHVGKEIPLAEAKEGDLILFTGTDSTIRVVGHMGIVTENTDSLRFIHSTSGRQYGVTITALGNYYKGRFVKVIRIF